MMLKALSSTMRQFGISPLDEGEIDIGAEAWAAVLYENQIAFGALTAAMVWTASVGTPRVAEVLELQKKRKQAELEKERAEKMRHPHAFVAGNDDIPRIA